LPKSFVDWARRMVRSAKTPRTTVRSLSLRSSVTPSVTVASMWTREKSDKTPRLTAGSSNLTCLDSSNPWAAYLEVIVVPCRRNREEAAAEVCVEGGDPVPAENR